ncbi:resolvase [Cystobacter fuscus]|uniref:Resolvase n=1 Tax=Cystobacter fuscus TaxID=43 RepID=A0A250IZF5_9BACT|nr:recombinase family protein [Cystobacter fuscus]ATB36296.1 resolvase [Cystobacter fuscus]
MKAACYLRVSTDEQTLENQRAPLQALCEARGWEPVWYEETWSGRDDRRPELSRLREDCRRGRVRAVAVVALDRLARSARTCLRFFEDADRWGVQVVSLRESWSEADRALRDLIIHVLAFAAELEVSALRERTRVGMRRAREKGTRSGRPIGRPRLSRTQLGAAAAMVQAGESQRKAAESCGVSRRALKRHLEGLGAPQNDERAREPPGEPPDP